MRSNVTVPRRGFLKCAAGFAAGLVLTPRAFAAPTRELRINRIVVQRAVGRRLTPVAPNAYAAYRGYDAHEDVLRIQTEQGIEGIARAVVKQDVLKALLGTDPFKLFKWTADDRIEGPADGHEDLYKKLGAADIALLDMLGKALNRPSAALLGKTVRETAPVYESSIYMEDMLTPEQQKDLAYMQPPYSTDPVAWVVRKAEWVLKRPEGFRALKIKLGRAKWMESFDAALARDIAVTNGIRKAVGPEIKLLVDGNKAYAPRPLAAAEYAAGVADSKVYFMEEMFPEVDLANMQELKKRLRAAGNPIKLAAGESYGDGLKEEVFTQRFTGATGEEPLVDIEQCDMNKNGFLRIRSKAARQAKLGMTVATHNFGSKLGLYAQAHLAQVLPNWDISEVDDCNFPAFVAEGVVIEKGVTKLAGVPGLGVRLKDELLEAPTVDLKA